MLNQIKKVLNSVIGVVRNDKSSRVLYYHDVHSSVKFSRWSTHYSLILKHFSEIQNCGYTIEKQISAPKNQIMICFDDGYRGIFEHKEIFLNRNIFPTIFLTVSNIGKDGFLTVEEIKELHSLGFEFGCHTYNHKDLWHLSSQELDYEIGESKKKLEKLLDFEISSICFPRGLYSDLVVEKCRQYKYSVFYSSSSKPYYKEAEPGLISRFLVQSASPVELKAILRGGEDWLYGYYIRKQKA